MNKEIERKFVLLEEDHALWAEWLQKNQDKKEVIVQAYMVIEENAVWRVRIKSSMDSSVDGGVTEKARWTFKQGTEDLAVRLEEEGEMDVAQATRMIAATQRRIRKIRTTATNKGSVFEVDEFKDELSGLFIIEVELPDTSAEINWPPGLPKGIEVTGDPKYTNDNLSKDVERQREPSHKGRRRFV
jgi:CYTH domain-containing protein